MDMLKTILATVLNLVIPESDKVKKLTALDANEMRFLLPKSPANMKNLTILFDYRNNMVKLLVKSIKYKNNWSLRKRVAGYLYEEIVDIASEISLFEGAPPITMPMPMSKLEKRNKGFNQCEELTQEIKSLSKGNLEVFSNILEKVRETKRQTTLSREERIQNVKNSMEVSPKSYSKIENRVVMVLDDVCTTFASFQEAERALLSAGAKRVLGIFIAH